jgi:Tfp pilus assembly protein PilO
MSESEGSQGLKKLGLLMHLGGVAVIGASAAAGLVLLLHPLHASVRELSEHQQMLEGTIEQSEAVRKTSIELQQRLADAETKLSELRKRIPDLPHEADFLGQMTRLAESTGIQLADYRPGSVREHPRYHEMDVKLTATGEYESICRLLQRLGELPRLCRVSRMVISAPEKGRICSIELTIVIFFTPPKPESGGKQNG